MLRGGAWTLLALGVATTLGCQPRAPASPGGLAPVSTRPGAEPASAWVAVGGGAFPESNQLSIEGDLALAARVFGPGGRVLFAGGPGTQGVQVTVDADRGDPTLKALGELFDPRGGRDATYRPVSVAATGPGTRDALADALDAAQDQASGGLLLYVAGHGEPAARAADVAISMWGGERLLPVDVATRLDAWPKERLVQLIVTTCFSGAFADVVFDRADPSRGAAANRCGLFASTWDRPASGCDPNPDCREHEGYGLYLLSALAGRDATGAPLPTHRIDIDGDGVVSLLDAHTWARIAGRGLDVPTTTSERWLRHVAPRAGRGPADVTLPHEHAVITALSAQLHVAPHDADGVASTVRGFERRIRVAEDDQATARTAEDTAAWRAIAELLARWPVLNDPWHPEFAAVYARDQRAVAQHLASSATYSAYLAAGDAAHAATHHLDTLMIQVAPWLRLARAHETLRLARRVASRGGPDWQRFLALRACERGAPPSAR